MKEKSSLAVKSAEKNSIMAMHCKHKVKLKVLIAGIFWLCFHNNSLPAQVPSQVRQLVVAIAPDWSSHRATLQCYQRDRDGGEWRISVEQSWPVLLGKNGLAWGRGVFERPRGTGEKREKDGCAPAGIFQLGPVFGYAARPPDGAVWSYVQVGKFDAWIDDPRLPHYNEHVRVDPRQVPGWFESQRMRLGDSAYKWLLQIKHNTNPATPGFGSAIFFHVRRGPDRPSAGCTTMAEDDLVKLIGWLRPDATPHYVLLPREVYDTLRRSWKLP